MTGFILTTVLLCVVLGTIPNWDYSRKWGFLPSGGFGLAALIIGAMWFYGRI